MEVVILCGGFGTRLPEETEYRPKPLVNVGGRPILWHIMKYYAAFGHTDFILTLGYKGEMIKEYFFDYELMSADVTLEIGRPEKLVIHRQSDEIGWRVTMADTGRRALKGARLKRAEKYVSGQRFFMTYGDGLANVDLNGLVEFHEAHGRLGTVTGINPTSRFGEIRAEGAQISGFSEKPKSAASLISGGFFVFEREIFDYVRAEDDCDLEVGAMEKVAADGQLMVYRHPDEWACMDTARDRDHLNQLWDSGQAFWKVW